MAKNRAGATVSGAKPVPPGKFGIYWPTFGGVVRGWVQALVSLPGDGWVFVNAAVRAAVGTWAAVTVLRAMGVALPG